MGNTPAQKWFERTLIVGAVLALLGVAAIDLSTRLHFAAGAPVFAPGYFRVASVTGSTLNVTDKAGAHLAVTVSPQGSMQYRFSGSFPVSDLAQIQTRDRIRLGYHATGSGAATAYLLQDDSLQLAHTEIKGTVTRIWADHRHLKMRLTAVYGGSDAAFKVGKSIVVATTSPSGVPVSYLHGGPSCGNVSCLTTGLTLELYGLSDRSHHLVEQPEAIRQVVADAPQLVHAPLSDE